MYSVPVALVEVSLFNILHSLCFHLIFHIQYCRMTALWDSMGHLIRRIKNFSLVLVNRSSCERVKEKLKTIWEVKVQVEKENSVPEVRFSVVVEAALQVSYTAAAPGVAEDDCKAGDKLVDDD